MCLPRMVVSFATCWGVFRLTPTAAVHALDAQSAHVGHIRRGKTAGGPALAHCRGSGTKTPMLMPRE